MTNIQAINLLKGLEQSLDDYCELNDEGKTAFRMAITALELFGNSEPLPSAQPEIIRCKDCKHWIPYDWMFNEVWQSKNIADYPEDDIGCALSDMAMKANDFCSRAVRREETT